MILFKFGCQNPQNCLQRFNVCSNLADDQYDKLMISQLINLIGNWLWYIPYWEKYLYIS